MHSAIDILKKEHETILSALQLLDLLCSQLEAGKEVEPEALQIAVDFIVSYANEYHHKKEEDILLPFVKNLNLEQADPDLEGLLEEHLLQRAYLKAMEDALLHSQVQKPNESFIENARNLIGLLSEHIFKENAVFLALAEKYFSQKQNFELTEALSKFDEQYPHQQKLKKIKNSFEALTKKLFAVKKEGCCGCCENS